MGAASSGEDVAVGRKCHRPRLPIPIDRLGTVLRLLLCSILGDAELSGRHLPVADGGIVHSASAGERLAVRRKAEAGDLIAASPERPDQLAFFHVPEPDNVVPRSAAGCQYLAFRR